MQDEAFENFEILKELILNENYHQIKKWGVQNHEPSEWLMFTTEELGELSEAISDWQFREGHPDKIIQEAIQVATLSLKIAEMFIVVTNQ